MNDTTKTENPWDHPSVARMSAIETQQAGMVTDIRGIYAGMDEIRDVLVRMQENAKPNLGIMFLVVIAVCTFLVTVGGLSLSPVHKEIARLNAQASADQLLTQGILQTRFTRANAERLEDRMLSNSQITLDNLIRMQEGTNNLRDRVSRLEGELAQLRKN